SRDWSSDVCSSDLKMHLWILLEDIDQYRSYNRKIFVVRICARTIDDSYHAVVADMACVIDTIGHCHRFLVQRIFHYKGVHQPFSLHCRSQSSGGRNPTGTPSHGRPVQVSPIKYLLKDLWLKTGERTAGLEHLPIEDEIVHLPVGHQIQASRLVHDVDD